MSEQPTEQPTEQPEQATVDPEQGLTRDEKPTEEGEGTKVTETATVQSVKEPETKE